MRILHCGRDAVAGDHPVRGAFAFDLKKRTLTNLYNERPAWLDHAHRALDAAVFAAYGWSPSMTDDALLAALLDLNLARPHVKGGKATAEPDPGEDGSA